MRRRQQKVDQTQEIVGKLRLFAENGLDIRSVAVLLDEVEQLEQLESSEIWHFPPDEDSGWLGMASRPFDFFFL